MTWITAAGILVVLLAMADLVLTTLTVRGGGPLSSPLIRWTWQALLWLTGGKRHGRLLALGGPLSVAGMMLMWTLLLWAGWTLVFLGGEGGVVSSASRLPARGWELAYYAGYTLFTLGLGDFRPEGTAWQLATAACSANGLLALTLSVTYLVPVVSAAASKRQLALLVGVMGGTPEAILQRYWDGRSLSAMEQPLDRLCPLIVAQSQQHLTYPALHRFHSVEPASALALRLAALDDTLHLLLTRVAPEAAPRRCMLLEVRGAIAAFLAAMDAARIEAAHEEPPLPRATVLGRLGVPQAEPGEQDTRWSLHRRLLLALVENDGWRWQDIHERPATPHLPGEG
ncbi:ion channel [Geminicoccaceae bacterium 1502E]|nr:ion channel [Geminicoccaceae bacterium 1502E]